MPNIYGGDQLDPDYAPHLYDKKRRLKVSKLEKRLREAGGLQKLVKKAEDNQIVETLCKAGLEKEFFEFDSNPNDSNSVYNNILVGNQGTLLLDGIDSKIDTNLFYATGNAVIGTRGLNFKLESFMVGYHQNQKTDKGFNISIIIFK